MNPYFLTAGVLLTLTFLVHIVFGNRAWALLKPVQRGKASERPYGVWLMGRAGIQMISADLCLAAAFTFLLGTGIIPYNYWLALFIALLYLGYCLFWLASLLCERARPVQYLRQCQWVAFLGIFLLMLAGIKFG